MNFEEACEEARKVAFSFKEPLIVHHYDADGTSSGAIVVSAFSKENRKYKRRCVKKVDDKLIDELAKEDEVIFVDLGGGTKRINELKDVVIIDHHQTEGVEKLQVNPLLYGIDGGGELSASGTAYSVFKEKVELAVVGAVGDMQYPLKGKNREIMLEGVEQGNIRIENDLMFYGRYSRSLIQFLEYSDDPYIPGISYREDRTVRLLTSLGIELKEEERYRRYAGLSKEEKTNLISALADILIERGRIKSVDDLIGESYVFPKNPMNESYEANEFSTLLNACGRHGKDDVAIGIALGKEEYFEEARSLLQLHRRMLKEGIEFASKNIQDLGKFFFLDGRGVIDESVIGIVCGMRSQQLWRKPIMGIARGRKGEVKVSTRGKKVNLGLALKEAATPIGGVGGGHRMAAGASIPEDKLNEFLTVFGEAISKANVES